MTSQPTAREKALGDPALDEDAGSVVGIEQRSQRAVPDAPVGVMACHDMNVYYGDFLAVSDVIAPCN